MSLSLFCDQATRWAEDDIGSATSIAHPAFFLTPARPDQHASLTKLSVVAIGGKEQDRLV